MSSSNIMIILTVFKWIMVGILLLSSGCASTRTISTFNDIPDIAGLSNYASPRDFLDKNFVPEAVQALKDIPLIRAATPRPYVAGVNFWSHAVSLLGLHGWGRKIVFPLDRFYQGSADETLLHEYVHHLDDMDRDGIAEFIDHQEFEKAFKALLLHPDYGSKAREIAEQSDHWITNIFGIGEWSEIIAYTAEWLYDDGGPQFMWDVFRNMLKRAE